MQIYITENWKESLLLIIVIWVVCGMITRVVLESYARTTRRIERDCGRKGRYVMYHLERDIKKMSIQGPIGLLDIIIHQVKWGRNIKFVLQ